MFPHWILPTALGLGLVAGLLIGAIGVGGVILVPCLLQLPLEGDEEERLATAVSSSMFSYIFAGLAGSCAYLRRKSVNRWSTAWLLVGVVPGAVLGAVTLALVKPLWIKVVLYSMVTLSALFSVYRSVKELRKTQAPASEELEPQCTPSPSSVIGALSRVGIGLMVGLGSAVTGTSGPVLLLPILLTLRWETLEALGSAQVRQDLSNLRFIRTQSQVLQLPLAAAAVCTFLIQGSPLNLPLGAALAMGLVPGVLMGAVLAHNLPVLRLRLGMAVVLIVASMLLLAKLILAQLTLYNQENVQN